MLFFPFRGGAEPVVPLTAATKNELDDTRKTSYYSDTKNELDGGTRKTSYYSAILVTVGQTRLEGDIGSRLLSERLTVWHGAAWAGGLSGRWIRYPRPARGVFFQPLRAHC